MEGYYSVVSREHGMEPFTLSSLVFGREKRTAGFCFVKNNGSIPSVDRLYYINGRPVNTYLKIGDRLVSINGILQENFDWSSWYTLKETDFVFERGYKNKQIAFHAVREDIIGGPEF